MALYMLQFVGVPYIYGGTSPNHGLDCSELAQIRLRAGGESLPKKDMTAQELFDWYSSEDHGVMNVHDEGALIFFGQSSTQISHVGVLLNDLVFLEAAGGASDVTTVAIANQRKAFVKMSSVDKRMKDSPFVSIIRPRYQAVQGI